MNLFKKVFFSVFVLLFIIFSSCKDEDDQVANLIFKFKFNPSLERLDNLGQPSTVAQGNAGQDPVFNQISAHYVELTSSQFVQVGDGEIIYHARETTAGGTEATDFNQAVIVDQNEAFFTLPIKDVTPGTYRFLRTSVTYQNYDVTLRIDSFGLNQSIVGTVASFVGDNTYIGKVKVKDWEMEVNGNRAQGFWGFETQFSTDSGSAAATTVPNPIASTSPIPPNSCLVTGQFQQDLVITGDETEDIVITISVSTNDSFEWEDPNGNGLWEPLLGENIVDMGLRGLIPSFD